MRTKRIVWTIIFLGITLGAIVMEVVAGVWHPAGTIPWTEYIAQYIPWPIQLIAYVTLAIWLPFHFWRADQKAKKAYHAGYAASRLDALTEQRAAKGPGSARQACCSHGYVWGSPYHKCSELPD